MTDWYLFHGDGQRRAWTEPPVPPWRQFSGSPLVPRQWEAIGPTEVERAQTYCADAKEVELVNVAMFLRRPLLVTGQPGLGKSTLAEAVAHELNLGPVLHWPITSRTTLQDGLYRYDAIGRLQDASVRDEQTTQLGGIGKYIQLGPVGTALLPYERPRVLLIDEIDKSDIDLPNDLLHIFERGQFEIPELARISDTQPEVEVRASQTTTAVPIVKGTVRCKAFPLVFMTSNGEREFPPAFLRRCIRLDLAQPTEERLARIVEAHLGLEVARAHAEIIDRFLTLRTSGDLATDQLLNAIFLASHTAHGRESRADLADVLLRHLNSG